MLIDDALLDQYMRTFVGFGSYEADFWLVGMEQGGGRDAAEIQRRLAAWRAFGCPEVSDLHEYLAAIGEARWDGPAAAIQPTLGRMIRVVLAAQGETASPAAIRTFQAERLGRAGGQTLLAELLPLPSQSVGHWIYAKISALPDLASRRAYVSALRPPRIALLRARIESFAPRVALFFGWSYAEYWRALVDAPLDKQEKPEPGILCGRRGRTLCVVSHHPAAFGITNRYFDSVGEFISTLEE